MNGGMDAGMWDIRVQGFEIKDCRVQCYRAVGYDARGCGNMGLWVVGCEDTELPVCKTQ